MLSEQIVTIVVALLSAGGFWAYFSKKSEQSYQSSMADLSARSEFQETLKEQVDRLAEKLDKVLADKERLLREVSELKASLARAEATIQHLEQRLMSK